MPIKQDGEYGSVKGPKKDTPKATKAVKTVDPSKAKISSSPLNKGTKKVVEKVEFRGNFRIVGVVFNRGTKVGYGIIDVKNYKLKLYTTLQAEELLKRYPFENAVLEGNTIKNTECSMDRLLQFDTYNNIIGNRGITILGEVSFNGVGAGYRAMDAAGKVIDISERDLIKVAAQTEAGILNAKIVEVGGKSHVSAIKGDFKKIEKREFEEMVEQFNSKVASPEQIKAWHKAYLEKTLKIYFHNFCTRGGINISGSKESKHKAKIVFKEWVFKEFPALKECKDSDLEPILTAALAMGVEKYGTKIKSNGTNLIVDTTYTRGRGRGRRQKYQEVPLEVLTAVAKTMGKGDAYNFLLLRNEILNDKLAQVEDDKNPVVTETLYKMLKSLRNPYYASKLYWEKRNAAKVKYNTGEIDYCDVAGIAQLGYTIDQKNVGKLYTSSLYGETKLRWLFDGLDADTTEQKYLLDNINCFGDIELYRKIVKALDHGSQYAIKYAQCMLFVIAMNNPVVAKRIFIKYQELQSEDLDIDRISQEKFHLDEADKIFYQSGGKFNKVATLTKNESWEGLNVVPGGTLAAMSLYLNIEEEVQNILRGHRSYKGFNRY